MLTEYHNVTSANIKVISTINLVKHITVNKCNSHALSGFASK